ncbi:MAG: VWA domain-containing protein, partial [Terracidiphilus sp.]|nr:VWA domain-containing protein [Terracidiphilus sp.]
MRDNFTRIAIVLDRSGSMESCKESTVAGFNEFIRTQREIPGEATVKLVQFDDQYETVFDKPLKECPELTQNTFVPRGSTALLDAQGRTIVEMGQELVALPESERPSKVIVVTLTDGMENASKQYNLDKIGEMIREQRDKYSWDFVFLGANQDAIATAAAMSIPLPSAMSYSTSKAGVAATMAAVSHYV